MTVALVNRILTLRRQGDIDFAAAVARAAAPKLEVERPPPFAEDIAELRVELARDLRQKLRARKIEIDLSGQGCIFGGEAPGCFDA